MIIKNRFYRQTNQKQRNLAAAQVVSKDGYRVELPAACFNKATGLMKSSVLKDVVGHLNEEQVQNLVKTYTATVLEHVA